MSATPSTNPPHDPLVGRVLQERYRIGRRLGEGGMGAVYEGEHLLIGNKVAIKVLHAKHAEDPDIVERFRREAQATTHIRHHHIVGMFDLGQLDDGSLYLVMEHLEGRDWAHDLAQEGPQPIAKVVHIFSQLCDALGAAHEVGIVHRDIKPDNIFLVRRSGDESFVKVLDFGISKIREGASALAPSKTQTGTAMGTPYYMAPEQVQGQKDIDARTDIYAMGVVLFQALTGQYPFDGETYPMLVMSIVTQPVPQLAAYRPDLPAELQRVLERMVAKDRAHRFGSVQEVKAALAPYAGLADRPGSAVAPVRAGVPVQSEVRVSAAPAAPVERGSSAKVLLAALAVLALLFAGAVTGALIAFWPGGEPEVEGPTPPTSQGVTSTEGDRDPSGAGSSASFEGATTDSAGSTEGAPTEGAGSIEGAGSTEGATNEGAASEGATADSAGPTEGAASEGATSEGGAGSPEGASPAGDGSTQGAGSTEGTTTEGAGSLGDGEGASTGRGTPADRPRERPTRPVRPRDPPPTPAPTAVPLQRDPRPGGSGSNDALILR